MGSERKGRDSRQCMVRSRLPSTCKYGATALSSLWICHSRNYFHNGRVQPTWCLDLTESPLKQKTELRTNISAMSVQQTSEDFSLKANSQENVIRVFHGIYYTTAARNS